MIIANRTHAKEILFIRYPIRMDVCPASCFEEPEIFSCIIIADVLDHFPDKVHVIGDQTVFHIIAEQVAQDPPEIFVTRVGKETP